MFGLFKKTDPICGMKEEKGKGIVKDGIWFCNKHCEAEYAKANKEKKSGGCCG